MKNQNNKNGKFIFLGLNFDKFTLQESLGEIERHISERNKAMMFTPTSELIVRSASDSFLREVYNRADLLTIDGYVVYYAARVFACPVKEPVSAVRLMFNFLKSAHERKYRLYMLGAKDEVVNKVVENLRAQYPGINIVGWHNGYFDFDKDEAVVEDIKKNKPDVLFVALSTPLKEKFISKNLEAMDIPVSIGVGGSFDIIAGKYSLAPEWISRIGLEWLYRLFQEPKRLFKRYAVTNSKFIYLLMKKALSRKFD